MDDKYGIKAAAHARAITGQSAPLRDQPLEAKPSERALSDLQYGVRTLFEQLRLAELQPDGQYRHLRGVPYPSALRMSRQLVHCVRVLMAHMQAYPHEHAAWEGDLRELERIELEMGQELDDLAKGSWVSPPRGGG